MKKSSKLDKRLVLNSEKLRLLSGQMSEQQLKLVAGAQPTDSRHCEGCDCSSAWC